MSVASEPRITVDLQHDPEGKPNAFILRASGDALPLSTCKRWSQLDHFKWVTRGLLEEPSSFQVHADGSVEINGQKISPQDADAAAHLAEEINKHHSAAAAPKAPASPAGTARHPAESGAHAHAGKVVFKVRLDHVGHMLIEALRGDERAETGIRGLNTLVTNGFMLKPGELHIDPLQHFIELDGIKFECNEPGARQLEEALNAKYAPRLEETHHAIEIKANFASPSGFDIHFTTVRVGTRIEVKGHLSQEYLDILQDPTKCDLLQPGIVLRLSPPLLLVRRRRPDGSEEKHPAFPEIHYRKTTAAQLGQVFNHPLIRRGGRTGDSTTDSIVQLEPGGVTEMRLVHNAQSPRLLWLESVTTDSGKVDGRAFSHHNLAELQHQGFFKAGVDVMLSLDHKTLSILDEASGREDNLTVDPQSPPEDLKRASEMLTGVLKPVAARRVEAPPAVVPITANNNVTHERVKDGATIELPPKEPHAAPQARSVVPAEQKQAPPVPAPPRVSVPPGQPPKPPKVTPPIEPQPAPASQPVGDVRVLEAFRDADLEHANIEIFSRLVQRLNVSVEQITFTLAMVFEDRLFEIINLGGTEVNRLEDLRDPQFYGFYLAHIHDPRTVLVYACRGRHVEWGVNRLLIQESASAEAAEYRGRALVGMAQDRENRFVFVIDPACLRWVKHAEKWSEVFVRFAAPDDLAAHPDLYVLLWPLIPEERPTEPPEFPANDVGL